MGRQGQRNTQASHHHRPTGASIARLPMTEPLFQTQVRFMEGIFTMRMRKLIIAACVLACCSAASRAWGQQCKPDFSETDKLTKEKYDVWTQVLSSKGGGVISLSTSNLTISALAWRQANVNYIQLRVQRSEQSAVNAGLTSAFRALSESHSLSDSRMVTHWRLR